MEGLPTEYEHDSDNIDSSFWSHEKNWFNELHGSINVVNPHTTMIDHDKHRNMGFDKYYSVTLANPSVHLVPNPDAEDIIALGFNTNPSANLWIDFRNVFTKDWRKNFEYKGKEEWIKGIDPMKGSNAKIAVANTNEVAKRDLAETASLVEESRLNDESSKV